MRRLIGLIGVIALAAALSAQDQAAAAAADPADLPALVERLVEVGDPASGYSQTVTATGFLPLDVEEVGVRLLAREERRPSPVLRQLVAAGARALPVLIEHLGDARPIALAPVRGLMWIAFLDEYDWNAQTRAGSPVGVNRGFGDGRDRPEEHQLTVGDLCFLAIGEIVNRGFTPARYQPSGGMVISSPTASPALRAAVIAEWGGTTPAQHRERLIADFTSPDGAERRAGAAIRIAFYYPDALAGLVVPFLATPTHDVFVLEDFRRKVLYPAPGSRRGSLIDAFIAEHGAHYRPALIDELFADLDDVEATEEHRTSSPFAFGTAPREILVEQLGYPPDVRSRGRPAVPAESSGERARFIKRLVYDRDPRITDAVLAVLAQDRDDDYLALGCFHRLIMNGQVQPIVDYCTRRVPEATTWKPELMTILGRIATAQAQGQAIGRELLPDTM